MKSTTVFETKHKGTLFGSSIKRLILTHEQREQAKTASSVLVAAYEQLNPKRAKAAELSICYVTSHNWEPYFLSV